MLWPCIKSMHCLLYCYQCASKQYMPEHMLCWVLFDEHKPMYKMFVSMYDLCELSIL